MTNRFSPTQYSSYLSRAKNEEIYALRVACARLPDSMEGKKDLLRREIAAMEMDYGLAAMGDEQMKADWEKSLSERLAKVREEIRVLMGS